MGRLFVSMALLFPWATKEYLLWEMTIGQIVMYHNIAMDIKYPKQEGEKSTLKNKTHAELKAYRDELRKQGLIDEKQEQQIKSEKVKESFRDKYGDV